MIIIILCYAPGEKQFKISFEPPRKPFVFDKKENECIETCMDRITGNVESFLSKKQSIMTLTEVCFSYIIIPNFQ